MFKVNNKDNRKTSKLGTFQKKFFICFNNSPSKMMKNAFYFILKVLFVLKIFVLTFWACKANGLIRKIRLISKFMMSQHG